MGNNTDKTIMDMEGLFTTYSFQPYNTLSGGNDSGISTLSGMFSTQGMITQGFFTEAGTVSNNSNIAMQKRLLQTNQYIPMSAEGDKTHQINNTAAGKSYVPSDTPNEFYLKGTKYNTVKCISKSSGEAQVFLVEKDGEQYVLKVMYPNFKVNSELQKIIANTNFEMIAGLHDFGKTYVEGVSRNYELMEYFQGGTLENTRIDDIDEFRRIALQGAAALAYCHNNKIIHKDIKPSNFFFRDKEHTQLVLGDFGISSLLKDDEYIHRTSQARTPVFAAPEMYTDVIDGEVEISAAADYYSLGITLMTIWLDSTPFNNINERSVIKAKSEGKLPRIDELPTRVKMLIQGLTTVNPTRRWDYDKVEQWFNGESPEIDISSPFLRYKDFIVDPDKNLVAHNVKELVPMLMSNEKLACAYLYGGRIGKWLTHCGNTKLSATINNIVTDLYPVNKVAGLTAAVYMMDPTYPYKDVTGGTCSNIHDVAMALLCNIDTYAISLCNPNDSLWIYIETHSKCNVNRMRSYFISGDAEVSKKAVIRTAYEIDPAIPFMLNHTSTTVKEIAQAFGSDNVTDDNWQSLTDGRLLSWMYSHEDLMTCESLRILTDGQKHDMQLAYRVLYNIDRDAAYDLKSADTPRKVGEILAEQLASWQSLSDEEFAEKMQDYTQPDGRFAYYAQLHGWTEVLSQASMCFDMSSTENSERLGAYDLRTAAYRFCQILGVIPHYVLPSGEILTDGRIIETNLYKEVRDEMRNGSFTQWLTVFYHEDPTLDFCEAYSYERMLEYWITALGEIDPTQTYFKRYKTAKNETERKYEEVKANYNKVKAKENTTRTIYYVLCGVWALLVLVCGISNPDYFIGHLFATMALPVGGMTAVIVGTRAYFKGFGFVMSVMWAILGALSVAVPAWLMIFTYEHFPALLRVTVLLITAVYMTVCYYTDLRTEHRIDKYVIDDVLDLDVKSQLLEPLYYTFKTKAFKYKGSNFGVLEDVQNQIRSAAGESFIHYILWSIMVAVLIVEMLLYSPWLLNLPNPDLDFMKPKPNKIEQQLKEYNNNIEVIKEQ